MDLTGLGSIFDFGGKLLDKIFPDPQKAQEAKIELFKLQQSGELAKLAADTDLAKGQLEVNKVEAASSSLFVSGWRPFIGWICGTGLGYQFLVYPILVAFQPHIVQLDLSTLLTLVAGMLGLGALRTQEKIAGVASK